jgi:hypothetical protein
MSNKSRGRGKGRIEFDAERNPQRIGTGYALSVMRHFETGKELPAISVTTDRQAKRRMWAVPFMTGEEMDMLIQGLEAQREEFFGPPPVLRPPVADVEQMRQELQDELGAELGDGVEVGVESITGAEAKQRMEEMLAGGGDIDASGVFADVALACGGGWHNNEGHPPEHEQFCAFIDRDYRAGLGCFVAEEGAAALGHEDSGECGGCGVPLSGHFISGENKIDLEDILVWHPLEDVEGEDGQRSLADIYGRRR